ERRQLLRPDVLHVDGELDRLAGKTGIRMILWIRHPQRQVRATMLPDELALERERKRSRPGFEQDVLTLRRLRAFESGGEVDGDHVARFHGRAIFDRPELRDGLAQVPQNPFD